jgi:ATP-dependent Clp protease ATP-binding subunit ClpC
MIVDLMISRLRQQLAVSGVDIQLTDAGRDVLVEKGYDPMLGARPLRRAIQRYIEDKLSDAMLERAFPSTVVIVDGQNETPYSP